MKNIILNNITLKLLALIIAVITWFYIVVELHKGNVEEKEVLQRMLPQYHMIAKNLPVKLNLVGEPGKGYTIQYDKIKIDPSLCIIVGPRTVLSRLNSINTQPIDITEYKKTFTKSISVEYPVKGIEIKEKFIKVFIPIIKME